MGRRIVTFSDVIWSMLFGKAGIDTNRSFMPDPRTALPNDVKMIGARIADYGRGDQKALYLMLESSEWEGPPEGEEVPRIDLFITSVYAPTTATGKEMWNLITRQEAEMRYAEQRREKEHEEWLKLAELMKDKIEVGESPKQELPSNPIRFREFF